MTKGCILLLLGFSLAFGCVEKRPEPVTPPLPAFEMPGSSEAPASRAAAVWVEEGRRHLLSGRSERAAQCFARAIEVDGSNAPAYFFLGVTRYERGRFTEASEYFGLAADLFDYDPTLRAEAWARRGESEMAGGDEDAARRWFERALSSDPSNGRAQRGARRFFRMHRIRKKRLAHGVRTR